MAGKRKYKLRIAYTLEVEAKNNYEAVVHANATIGAYTDDKARNIKIETVGSYEIAEVPTPKLVSQSIPDSTGVSTEAEDTARAAGAF